jgi:hypothetical protein
LLADVARDGRLIEIDKLSIKVASGSVGKANVDDLRGGEGGGGRSAPAGRALGFTRIADAFAWRLPQHGVKVTTTKTANFAGYPCEPHALWDTDMLRHMGLRERRYVLQLEELIDQQHLQASGNPEQWANESFRDAKAAWVDPGTNIDGAYLERELPVVNERLVIAGLRLAALLNADLKGP